MNSSTILLEIVRKFFQIFSLWIIRYSSESFSTKFSGNSFGKSSRKLFVNFLGNSSWEFSQEKLCYLIKEFSNCFFRNSEAFFIAFSENFIQKFYWKINFTENSQGVYFRSFMEISYSIGTLQKITSAFFLRKFHYRFLRHFFPALIRHFISKIHSKIYLFFLGLHPYILKELVR